ncbi:MAG: hypothetical protein QOK05_2078 [Chloroflexota bacterium]|jgi:glycosyltransferase involved in cell wall biosynthesis|nr:hypothetical protein [Chloroflexota bacterium]
MASDILRVVGVRTIDPGDSLGLSRDQVLVCIPAYGAYHHLVQCLRSVLMHTAADIPILVADDASPDHKIGDLLPELESAGLLDRELIYSRQPANVGFVENVNSALAAAAPADVVILNSDCVVADGWLDGLHQAAYSDTSVATATALTNNGTIVSVPHRNQGMPALPQQWTLDAAADAVKRSSLRIRPRIPTAIGHCFYVRRSAMDLVGYLDTAFSPGYGEEVDFSQRCLMRGLVHVVADDVLVLHHQGGSFGNDARIMEVRRSHDAIISQRYPYYDKAIRAAADNQGGPLARALGVARRALTGTRVTIDASCLGPALTGTQLQTLELLHALWQTREVKLRVVLPRDLGGYARDVLDEMPDVERLLWNDVDETTSLDDVVHRAYQVTSAHDIEVMKNLGHRMVITQQDLIAYRNPGYFPNYEAWNRYRGAALSALMEVDRVHFFSRHAAEEAVAEDLVEPGRADVVYIGVDHHLRGLRPAPEPPAGLDGNLDGEFLLYIGTDFRHKNRVFALQVLEALQLRHGWTGKLVLAGPQVSHGSSAADEADFLLRHPQVEKAVVRLGLISEANKAWLLPRARAVVYPTLHEGFGLIPFEAADAGVPTLCAPETSLAELLPPEATILVPWDVAQAADQAHALLHDEAARDRIVEAVLTAASQYTWSAAARGLLAVYQQAADAPSRSPVQSGVSALGLRLVGPSGILPDDVQQALWALSIKPRLRQPIFGGLTLLHRAIRKARSRGRRAAAASGAGRRPSGDA